MFSVHSAINKLTTKGPPCADTFLPNAVPKNVSSSVILALIDPQFHKMNGLNYLHRSGTIGDKIIDVNIHIP